MSLILEALKKLDREKQAPDRGVVVVGPAAWATPGDSGFPMRGAVLVVAALAVGAAAGAVWLARGTAQSAAPAQQAAERGVPAQPAVGSAPSLAPPSVVAAVPTTGARSRSARGFPAAPRIATKAAPDLVPPGESADATPPGDATSGAGPGRKPGRGAGVVDFELQAISAQNGHPVAVLNDRLVREGDTFDGVTVVRIGADEVEIEVAGHRRIVKF